MKKFILLLALLGSVFALDGAHIMGRIPIWKGFWGNNFGGRSYIVTGPDSVFADSTVDGGDYGFYGTDVAFIPLRWRDAYSSGDISLTYRVQITNDKVDSANLFLRIFCKDANGNEIGPDKRIVDSDYPIDTTIIVSDTGIFEASIQTNGVCDSLGMQIEDNDTTVTAAADTITVSNIFGVVF